MGCDAPVKCFRLERPLPNGKRPLYHSRSAAPGPVVLFERPCYYCIGCRLARTSATAARLTHEARYHKASSFLTLTYDAQHLPSSNSIVSRDLQNFWKRVRKSGLTFKYYACGEYGEQNGRPHYHACVFGQDFSSDRKLHKQNPHPLYVSDTLSKHWKLGHATIGALTFETAAYTAGYCLKKLYGDLDDYSQRGLLSPRSYSSNGLGLSFFHDHYDEIYAHDSVLVRGHSVKVPRYYDQKFEELFPERFEEIKEKRALNPPSPINLTVGNVRGKIHTVEALVHEASLQQTRGL